MMRNARFIRGMRDSAEPWSSASRRVSTALWNGRYNRNKIDRNTIGALSEEPLRRHSDRQNKTTAVTRDIHAPRESVKINAVPPTARTAAASHLYLRPASVNSTLNASESIRLRYAPASFGDPTVPPTRVSSPFTCVSTRICTGPQSPDGTLPDRSAIISTLSIKQPARRKNTTNSRSSRLRTKLATYRNTKYICRSRNNSKLESLTSRATTRLNAVKPR